MKHSRVLLLVASLSLALPACEDDPAQPGKADPARFQPLTTRNAVLHNLELAWNTRDPGPLDELLDADYTFYFSAGDVGGSIPPTWNRAQDLFATTALLESNVTPPATGPVCVSVRFGLANESPVWDPISPPAALGDAWYMTIVNYTFTFETLPDNTYIQPSAAAQFVVRPVGDEWRLVELRDLGQANAPPTHATTGASQATWGAIKALYDGAGS